MGVSAIDRTGGSIIASNIPSPVWESWKGSSGEHGLRMECCGAIAVAKTSPNGVQFFAHISNECATAPETVWHIGAKALVVDGMRRLGATCSEEVFEGGDRPWKADVLVQWAGRRIAIEIQRSYQHLRDFERRQQRYRDADVECVWLLPRDAYHRLAKATGRVRLKEEFGGRFPASGSIGPCLRHLPVASLHDPERAEIAGAGLFRVTLDAWCRAILERQFQWYDGLWMIGTDPSSPISGIHSPVTRPTNATGEPR